MSEMTRWERVTAALAGQEVDRVPVSLWQHFPNRDQTARDLADVTLEWQAQFDFDFIKLMPPGDYVTIDWGAKSEYQGAPGGTRETTVFPIETLDDWRKIKPVPVDQGMNREVIETVRLVNERLEGQVPLLQTIFSPLTVAMKLSGGTVLDHLRERPEVVHEALGAITEVTRNVLTASLERGAGGIFFATQCATTDLMSVDEYQEFGVRYDLPVLEAAGASRFTLLHLHGDNIMFDALKDYPVHALNWHDRRTPPTLAEGHQASGKCIVGGLNEREIATMSESDAAAQARDAIAQLGGRHVMVTPGCVIPIATPATTISAVVQAVRNAAS